MPGALTFHLPLELFALEAAGASREQLAAAVQHGLAEAFAAGLVDPPLYRWAVDQYRAAAARLLDNDRDVRLAAFSEIEAVGEGLVGAAFHGIIRCGFAVLRQDPAELARGLGYMRARRQVLGGPSGAPTAAESPIPSAAELHEVTVSDQLNLAAVAGGPDPLCDPSRPLAAASDFAARAASLIMSAPDSFVAVHTMTGLHGLCEMHRQVTGVAPADNLDMSPLARWWRAYAAGLYASSVALRDLPAADADNYRQYRDLEQLTADAVASGDAHNVKLMVAMGRLHEMGVLSEEDVLRVGSGRLATTC
jgi:hypothetical protein